MAPIEFELISAGELLRRHPAGRISGWDPTNPPQVELAFRIGYARGAAQCAKCDLVEAAGYYERWDVQLGESYRNRDVWSDHHAALLRGMADGALEMIRARTTGVKRGIGRWLRRLDQWADESPIRLDWSSARPPDPPAPDARPLRLDDVPRQIWSQVFGMWAAMDREEAA